MTTTKPPDELRIAQGEAAKQLSMEIVEVFAQEETVAELRVAVQEVIKRLPRWTNDDVWDLWTYEWQKPMPPEPRLLGPIIHSARVRRWMSPTGEWVKSRRPECHRRSIPVYRSRGVTP